MKAPGLGGWAWATAALLLASGCGGGSSSGGGGGSEATIDIDGTTADSTSQTSGVDAAGSSFVILTGSDWSIEIRFPGSGTGTFSSGTAGAARIVYRDSDGNAFLATDVDAGSTYQIDVTSYSASGIEGTFTATVVGPASATHTLSGSFRLAFTGLDASDPYGGTYIGVLQVRGQIQTGTDPGTGDPIWGPMQSASLLMTLQLTLQAAQGGTALYEIEHANLSDPFFDCDVDGCVPDPLSGVYLPETPGTPTPNGPSSAGHGFEILFPNGSSLSAAIGAGELYSSSDGRTLGSALGVDESWSGSNGSDPYVYTSFGDYFANLNPDTRSTSWSLSRSAY